MKVSLVVASGVHQGKLIPIVGSQFLVGRDPQCQLRPASQAVSKQHCAILIRDGQVFLRDFGSTNGTILNDAVVQDEERPIANNDSLKIGPLDFIVRIEARTSTPDGTPLPDLNPETAAALAAVKAVSKAAPPIPLKDLTPAPGSKEAAAVKGGSKDTPSLSASTAAKSGAGAAAEDDAENDRLAAMLLGLDDGEVPGGSTVVDVALPADVAAAAAAAAGGAKEGEKTADKKAPPTREDTSNAASEILRRYMRRPR